MQETKPQYNRSLGYAKTMFRQFPVFTVLPNLRKQISLICLLSILKISQPKHGYRFILVTLYFQDVDKTSYVKYTPKLSAKLNFYSLSSIVGLTCT
jgi:hypothetical protein